MKITFYGHSCFGIETGGNHLLFDPFISPNPAASSIDIDSIPCDYLLISHGHGDHVADAVAIAKRTGATVMGNFEVISWFNKQGIEKTRGMNTGGQVVFPFGTVKFVNAIHSSTMPDGSPGGIPGGFVVTTPGSRFYYSGDTALTYDMKLIGEYQRPDFAFLCMGDNFTMGPEDAVIAAEFIQCDRIIGMHFDTFPPIQIDHDKAQADFHAAGKKLILPKIGESWTM